MITIRSHKFKNNYGAHCEYGDCQKQATTKVADKNWSISNINFTCNDHKKECGKKDFDLPEFLKG